jgi:hypothetical protein
MPMYILIPVNGDNEFNAKIVPLAEMKRWALVEFVEGEVKSLTFFEDREKCNVEWIDFVVLDNKFENYIDFMNEGMMCLVRREEETIEEIMSAFAFKELDEIGL